MNEETGSTSRARSVDQIQEIQNKEQTQAGSFLVSNYIDAVPGPSGIATEMKPDELSSDSDCSVEIIEVPKKPPVIIEILDDSDSDTFDISNSETIAAKLKSTQKTSKTKSKGSIKDHIRKNLEQRKDTIFVTKQEHNDEEETPEEVKDLTCAICLGQFESRAFLDQCFHSYCFTCILQWAEVVHKCPLCKADFGSLIYNVTPELEYDQYILEKPASESTATVSTDPRTTASWIFSEFMDDGRRFRYRSTLTGDYSQDRERERQRRYDREVRRRERRRRQKFGQIDTQGSRWAHSAATQDLRRRVYRDGLVIKEVKYYGRPRYREITPTFFRENPAVTHRLVPWILRDLNALPIVGDIKEHVSFIMHLILSLIVNIPMDSTEFRMELEPFLFANTEQFVQELISFAKSPYDVKAYDDNVVYDYPNSHGYGTWQPPVQSWQLSLQQIPLPSHPPLQPEWQLTNVLAHRKESADGPILGDKERSIHDKIMDEVFTRDHSDNSPPLQASPRSSSSDQNTFQTDTLNVNSAVGRNSDDSDDVVITRVVAAKLKTFLNDTLRSMKESRHPRHSRDDEKTGGEKTYDSNLKENEREVKSSRKRHRFLRVSSKSSLSSDSSVSTDYGFSGRRKKSRSKSGRSDHFNDKTKPEKRLLKQYTHSERPRSRSSSSGFRHLKSPQPVKFQITSRKSVVHESHVFFLSDSSKALESEDSLADLSPAHKHKKKSKHGKKSKSRHSSEEESIWKANTSESKEPSVDYRSKKGLPTEQVEQGKSKSGSTSGEQGAPDKTDHESRERSYSVKRKKSKKAKVRSRSKARSRSNSRTAEPIKSESHSLRSDGNKKSKKHHVESRSRYESQSRSRSLSPSFDGIRSKLKSLKKHHRKSKSRHEPELRSRSSSADRGISKLESKSRTKSKDKHHRKSHKSKRSSSPLKERHKQSDKSTTSRTSSSKSKKTPDDWTDSDDNFDPNANTVITSNPKNDNSSNSSNSTKTLLLKAALINEIKKLESKVLNAKKMTCKSDSNKEEEHK